MTTFIAFLRGINVGGNKKINMADLRALFESLGFPHAQTLLQSGNVVFTADESDQSDLSGRIEVGIQERFGFESKVIIRAGDELLGIIAAHPFNADQLTEPGKIAVVFLADAPDSAALDDLRAAHTGPETIHANGRELYIFYTEGMGRSKLTNNLIEKRLNVTGTTRNWNTVNKLAALAEPDD